MFDPRYEKPIPLSEVPNLPFVQTREGKKLHKSTVWRWAQKGLDGIRLETIKVGGVMCTSAERLTAFFNRNNPQCHEATWKGQAAGAAPDTVDAVLARAGIL